MNTVDKFFGADILFTSTYHYRGPMRIIGAEIQALVAAELLETNPYIRLQVLDEMADVCREVTA